MASQFGTAGSGPRSNTLTFEQRTNNGGTSTFHYFEMREYYTCETYPPEWYTYHSCYTTNTGELVCCGDATRHVSEVCDDGPGGVCKDDCTGCKE